MILISKKIPWMKVLLENREKIIAEIPVIPGSQTHPGWQESIYEGKSKTQTGKWLSYYLFQGGNAIVENQKRCPTLMKVLESIPYMWFGTVSLSALTPKSSIIPHFGEYNHELRCQLPLVGYSESQITVGGIEKQYTEEPVIFDDTFYHSVKNQGDKTRIVLLFDFLHTDFTPSEALLMKEALQEYNTQLETTTAKEQVVTSTIQPPGWFVQ